MCIRKMCRGIAYNRYKWGGAQIPEDGMRISQLAASSSPSDSTSFVSYPRAEVEKQHEFKIIISYNIPCTLRGSMENAILCYIIMWKSSINLSAFPK